MLPQEYDNIAEVPLLKSNENVKAWAHWTCNHCGRTKIDRNLNVDLQSGNITTKHQCHKKNMQRIVDKMYTKKVCPKFDLCKGKCIESLNYGYYIVNRDLCKGKSGLKPKVVSMEMDDSETTSLLLPNLGMNSNSSIQYVSKPESSNSVSNLLYLMPNDVFTQDFDELQCLTTHQNKMEFENKKTQYKKNQRNTKQANNNDNNQSPQDADLQMFHFDMTKLNNKTISNADKFHKKEKQHEDMSDENQKISNSEKKSQEDRSDDNETSMIFLLRHWKMGWAKSVCEKKLGNVGSKFNNKL